MSIPELWLHGFMDQPCCDMCWFILDVIESYLEIFWPQLFHAGAKHNRIGVVNSELTWQGSCPTGSFDLFKIPTSFSLQVGTDEPNPPAFVIPR